MPPSDDQMTIPASFWKGVNTDEFMRIVMNGGLDAEQCRRLWTLTGRRDPVPKKMKIYVNAADVMRIFPAPSQRTPQ